LFDPNIISVGHGFKELKEGYFIYSTTSRKAKQMKLPEGFVLDEPNKPLDFRPVEENNNKPKDD